MPPSFQTGYPVMIELSPDFILQSERRRKGLRSANTRTSAMNSCTLFPPNTQNLSDRVISSVVQRAWVRDGDISNEADSLEDAGDLHTPPMRPQFSAYTPARRENQYQPADVSENTPVRPNAVRPVEMTGKRRMKHRATRDFVLDQHDVANSSLSIKSTTTRGLSRKSSTISAEEHQRELRRLRQIRYRKKKFDLTLKLEEDTLQLREEVEQLEQRRRAIAIAVPTSQNMWDVVLKYYQVFRYGVQERASNQKSNSGPPVSSSPQLELVLATMTEDVVFNSCRGLEAVMEGWKCQTLWFKDFEMELESLVKGSKSSLVTSTTISFTIAERTMLKVFPHLSEKNGYRSGGLRSRVVKTLMGQRITVRGSARFEWDGVLGRVSRVTTQSDLLTPVLLLLGNLDDVSYVFERALISPDFKWRQLQ